MVRIGGGVFPDIKEKDYLANGQYRIDGEVTKVTSGAMLLRTAMRRLALCQIQVSLCTAACWRVGRARLARASLYIHSLNQP